MQFTAFNDDWSLNNELANFLHLNREQYEYVNDAVNYTVSLLVMLEDKHLQWQTPEPGKVVIDILPFPEEGAQLQEDLYAAIELAAGSERLDLFINAAQASLDECFHYFGKATRSVVFQRTYVDGKPRLFIYDGWYWLGDNGRNDMRATELVVDKIPPAYAAFVPYLPAEIRDWIDKPAVQQTEEVSLTGFEL